MNEKGSNSIPIRDYTGDIIRFKSMKAEGNQLINSDINEAIKKYNDAYRDILTLFRVTSEREKESNSQLKQIETIRTQLASNLALCYFKLKEYQKSVEYDKSIISVDMNYDKSYARLFKCSMALKDIESAVRYARILKVWFNQETLDKYQDVFKDIQDAENVMKDQADQKRAIEKHKAKKKKAFKSISYMLIILAAIGYSYY